MKTVNIQRNEGPNVTDALPEGRRALTLAINVLALVEHGVSVPMAEAICRQWDAKCAELAAARPRWLPIDTAPRDGTFLIYGKGRNGEYITDAKMIDGKVTIFDAMSDCYGWEAETATHWMPLPEGPK